MNLFLGKTGRKRIAESARALLAALILTGCATVGPDYTPPATELSKSWHTPLKSGSAAEEAGPASLENWWTNLNDPELSSLVARAVEDNRDLRKARARVRQAWASRGVTRAGLFPTLDVSSSATRSRSSEETGGGTTSSFYVAGSNLATQKETFELTRWRQQAGYKYQSGLADFDSVLEAQRSLLILQEELAQSNGAVLSNLIRLYKALGGGWTSLAAADEKQEFTNISKRESNESEIR